MASKLHHQHADEESGKSAAMVHSQPRRKGIGTRVWLVVSESGHTHIEEVGKHSIMRRTGLPARDLRVLDPMLSYPSTILGRERAIVINLEHIMAIITAKEVLMVNSTNPLVVQFVQDLQERVSCSKDMQQQATKNCDTDMEDAVEGTWGSPSINSHHVMSGNFNNLSDMPNTEKGSSNSATGRPEAPAPKLLPFEFRALEVCLESACRCLESETQTLEQEAYPALDELTSKISTLNLERVRQIKSRLVAISGRVQKVRDELEHLLDDDNDMAEMYLTEKFAGHSMDHTSLKEELYDEALEDDEDRGEETKSQHSYGTYTGIKPNIEELEMLLEAYFAQIDGISQKLFHMSEYVNDTEDFINIMLDEKQNQLLQMGVMLSTANMIMNAGIVVVGLFGMNIEISLFSSPTINFWETAIGTIGGCVAMYLIAVGWGKKKSLI
ncbi:Magnesium transporter MRS2-F [Camellia lanceoleosa]|uniref:Magnesium transporter MRS2-F n=1 Tax=Camellia lanceoleosa TaxID=1840588 RepID=A0ACC0IXR7_9ERIC|nr:Magnesium transporter MRS2-F [Camellia lanceoleosa]